MSIQPDADLHNADWAKRTWDLPTDLGWYIVRYGDDLADWLVRFIQLPAAEAMPEQLRADLFAAAGVVDTLSPRQSVTSKTRRTGASRAGRSSRRG